MELIYIRLAMISPELSFPPAGNLSFQRGKKDSLRAMAGQAGMTIKTSTGGVK
jgi:hypothetical protein